MPLRKIEDYPLTEAKDKFSALTAQANASGMPFRVLKGGKPWVVVSPVSTSPADDRDGITIQPVKRTVPVADLDALFVGYDGDFTPHEGGFADPVGSEGI